MQARLTIAGLNEYRSDLFDNLVLPVPPVNAAAIGLQADQLRAAWTIDKDDFISFLCLETMGMSVAYPDADFMKLAIGTWSRSHIHEWQRMFDTLFFKYNPLWNKDGKVTESGTDTHAQTETDTGTGSGTGSSTTTGNTHGYNATDPVWTPSDQTQSSSESETETSSTHTDNGTNTFSHTRLEQGNIGVTMNQELIEREREMAKFSIEEYIANEFKKTFCLMIW